MLEANWWLSHDTDEQTVLLSFCVFHFFLWICQLVLLLKYANVISFNFRNITVFTRKGTILLQLTSDVYNCNCALTVFVTLGPGIFLHSLTSSNCLLNLIILLWWSCRLVYQGGCYLFLVILVCPAGMWSTRQAGKTSSLWKHVILFPTQQALTLWASSSWVISIK